MKKIIVLALFVCLMLTSCQTNVKIDRDEWGLVLSVENVTDVGLTINFTQSGDGPTGELQTGSWYTIDKNENGEWTPLETEPLDFAWTMIAYMIKSNDTTKLDVNWEWLYGKLPKGKYRINKEITDFRATGDYDEKIYSAEFEIS